MKKDISLIVLTYNEEIHLKRCLESVKDVVEDIFIVDSFSNDRTIEIAKEYGANVFKNKWPGDQSKQINWFLKKKLIKTTWVFRIDADEYILPELGKEIIENTLKHKKSDINGFVLKRRHIFLNKWIKYGGVYPTYILRIWKKDTGYWENRSMDEHFILNSGSSLVLKNDFVDHNLNDLSWWIAKHNNYSDREVNEYFKTLNFSKNLDKKTYKKRILKNNIYYKTPLFLRSFLYFIYRYFLLLGFLDGIKGIIWNFLQAYWYRSLVDFKIYEKKNKSK